MKKIRKVWLAVLLITLLAGCGDDAGQLETVAPVEPEIAAYRENNADLTGEEAASAIEDQEAETMEVHFLDVGQSDATLIMNGEHAMLIDAGENDQGTSVQLYLQKRGIKHLDYLVLTHTDSDHIGGADVILTKLEVDTVFMGDFVKDTATYRDVIQALDNKSLNFQTPEPGEIYSLGDASFTIVAPNGNYQDANNTSIGLLLEKGEDSFLFTGDAEEEAEADMLRNGLSLQAEVYQVGHHGSRTSTTEDFLDAVQPVYAVISCGEGNDYGHPHAQTLNRLRTRGIQVFRTDEQGSIVAVTQGNGISWNSAPSDSWIAGEPKNSAQTASKQQAESSIGAAADAESHSYICNTSSHKFHLPSCNSVSQMSDKNKMEITCTREEIVAQGYEPCKNCSP